MTREEAIKLLHPDTTAAEVVRLGYDRAIPLIDEATILACEDMRRMQNDGWIPVEERLPEKAGTYLVCTQNQCVCTAKYRIFGTGEWGSNFKNCVIAWQETPAPYRIHNDQ